jgi:hypothetical protein
MDAKLFRLPTSPNYYAPLQSSPPAPIRDVRNGLLPAPDNRYEGWAGPMSDGRLVTDYTPSSSKNIPAGQQFPTKAWMQKHGTDIIEQSRKVAGEKTGSIFPFDSEVVPPAESIMTCKKSGCSRKATDAEGGLGMVRGNGGVPELFGTFHSEESSHLGDMVTHLEGTTSYEGGRNSIRGRHGPAPI